MSRLGSVQAITLLVSHIANVASKLRPGRDIITLRFTKEKKYFPPFCMLYLGIAVRQIRLKSKVFIVYDNTDVDWLGYAKKFGFFELQSETPANDLKFIEREAFMPIQNIAVPDISIDDNEVHASEVVRMQAISDNLASRLLQKQSGNTFDTLSYLCREILRNIIEHSYSSRMYYCAQFYPQKDIVSVVIADEGEGVRSSLNENPDLSISSDREALKQAILPGMSGRSHKYTSRNSAGHIYANSGYGLFMTRRICETSGDFLIASGDAGVSTTAAGITHYDKVRFDGTILRLSINLAKVSSIDRNLEVFRREALTMKSVANAIGKVTPSVASTMIRLPLERNK